MTNREWLESLTDDEFVEWLVGSEDFDQKTMELRPPTPKLETIKRASTSTVAYLKEWLKEERRGNGER